MGHTLVTLIASTIILIPTSGVLSYSRVSKYGSQSDVPVDSSPATQKEDDNVSMKNQGRSAQDIPITISPIYPAPKIPDLQPGEAVDYTTIKKPSVLDKELLAQMNSMTYRKKSNDRYTPPSIFQTGKKVRGPTGTKGEFSKPDVAFPESVYDYSSSDFASDSKPQKPALVNGDSDDEKVPDFIHHTFDGHQDFSNFDGLYEEKPPSSYDYPGHHSSFTDDHDITFDHIPDHHINDDHHLYHYHYDHSTTEKPEMNDQRLSKRPYSYYYIGKKLWYLPLYFSIYFIIYVAALVLKSIARHKINFPANLAAAAANGRFIDNSSSSWWDLVKWILEIFMNHKTIL